jgi:hypothetical protein
MPASTAEPLALALGPEQPSADSFLNDRPLKFAAERRREVPCVLHTTFLASPEVPVKR